MNVGHVSAQAVCETRCLDQDHFLMSRMFSFVDSPLRFDVNYSLQCGSVQLLHELELKKTFLCFLTKIIYCNC